MPLTSQLTSTTGIRKRRADFLRRVEVVPIHWLALYMTALARLARLEAHCNVSLSYMERGLNRDWGKGLSVHSFVNSDNLSDRSLGSPARA